MFILFFVVGGGFLCVCVTVTSVLVVFCLFVSLSLSASLYQLFFNVDYKKYRRMSITKSTEDLELEVLMWIVMLFAVT